MKSNQVYVFCIENKRYNESLDGMDFDFEHFHLINIQNILTDKTCNAYYSIRLSIMVTDLFDILLVLYFWLIF